MSTGKVKTVVRMPLPLSKDFDIMTQTRQGITRMVTERVKKASWLEITGTVVAITAVLVPGLLWVGGRLEAPEAKEKRIRTYIAPLELKIDDTHSHVLKNSQSLADYRKEHLAHTGLSGHSVMVERVQHMQADLSTIKKDVSDILRKVQTASSDNRMVLDELRKMLNDPPGGG